MSRILIIVGLLTSLVAHAWLLARPAPPAPPPAKPVAVVPVVETELASVEVDPPSVAESQVDAPTPEPIVPPPAAPAPAPEPEPAPTPEPLPPPAPMAHTAEPTRTETEETGDFAGTATGRREPALRVDWGTPAEAISVLEVGGMQVVILDAEGPTPIITHELIRTEDRWRRRAYQPPAGSMRFSNRLRIVDDVPAFDAMRKAARPTPTERLAVLVPVAIESMLATRQIAAAFDRGLTLQEIADFAGRFSISDGTVGFQIEHVGVAR